MSIFETLSKTFPEEQAKSIVMALEEFETEKQHVTKEQMDSALSLQTAEINTRMKDTEIRLIKWVIALMIAQTSITIALLKM